MFSKYFSCTELKLVYQLRKFFDAEDGREAFTAYANQVCSELAAKISGPAVAEISSGDSFGIFGHAVFLNAVAYVVADAFGLRQLDDVLDVDLGEAEVLVVNAEEGGVTHLHTRRGK